MDCALECAGPHAAGQGKETFIDYAQQDINLNTQTKVTIDSPMTHVTGQLQVDQLLAYSGGMAGFGSAGGGAAAAINGTIQVTGGDVVADTISLKGHKTSGVQPGSGTSSVPVP